DPAHPVGVQLIDLARYDDAAAAAPHRDMPGPLLPQEVDYVLEVLDVPALVRADRDRLRVLLDRGVDDLLRPAVVTQMDHLGPTRLEHPPHHPDRRVVAVEQRGRRDDPDLVPRD